MTPGRLRRVARRAGSLAAVGVVGSLAGCGGADSHGSTDESGEQDGSAGDTGDGSGNGDTSGGEGSPGTSSGGSTNDGDGSTTGGAGDEDCATRVERLSEEAEAAAIEVENYRWQYDDVAIPARGLQLLADQLEDGFPDETIAAAEAVAVTARESVVYVTAYLDGHRLGSGTGWYVSEHEIVTNAHVVKDAFTMETADRIDLVQFDGRTHAGHVTGSPPESQPDMAIVETNARGTPLPVGSDATLTERQPLVQIGHPGGVGNWYVTMGMFVSRRSWTLPNGSSYVDLKTTVPGRGGVSGAPLLDLEGTVVGLTWGASPPWQREFGESPVVAPDVVYDTPLVEIGLSNHLAVDSVAQYLEAWR